MDKNNDKVPSAILCCFLIAFILQGILKLSGVLIFEKALDWQIFKLIDNNTILQVIFYSIIMLITLYCLSFSLTDRPYSKKWYHYFIIVCVCGISTSLRTFIVLSNFWHIIIDIIVYILVPFIIDLTTEKEHRLLANDVYSFVLDLSIHICMYLFYLGISYWSGVLTSLFAISPVYLTSSAMFIIKFETYLCSIMFMLSLNILTIKLKRRENMHLPVDIASDEAKIKEIEEKENAGK